MIRVTGIESTFQEHLNLLKSTIARGEALLILGQDHTPTMVDQVLLDAKALLAPSAKWKSLAEIFTTIGSSQPAQTTVNSLFGSKEPDVALLELASLPWMAVVTSAVDPLISQAFLNAGSQRRLVELGPTQISGISAGRATQVLQLIRVFGLTTSHEKALEVPSSSALLSQARLLGVPAVAAALPRMIGIHGRVVVSGVSSRDWLNEQAIAPLLLVLSALPDGTVYWFGEAPDLARSTLSDRTYYSPEPFDQILFTWSKAEAFRTDLREAQTRVFGVGERAVSIFDSGIRRVFRLTASEWRSISAVGSVIDDSTLSDLSFQSTPTRQDLVNFLRKSHSGVPDWSGPARGLVFERAAVRALVAAAEEFVERPKASVLDPTGHSGGAPRVPFVLSGPPASGKTTGLMQAAWTLRKDSKMCVLWLYRRVLGPDVVAIEHVCRMLEAKGAGWVVICLDSPDPEEYARLKRRLESEGRRVLILGTESRAEKVVDPNDAPSELGVRRFFLNVKLTDNENVSIRAFFDRFGIQLASWTPADILRSLADAVPETQFGAFPSLLDEYERVLTEAKNAMDRDSPPAPASGTSLAAKLRELFPDLMGESEQLTDAVSRFDSVPLLRELLNMVLFCSQLERPIPVDFLFKTLGSELIANYRTVSEALSRTALIDEVELDDEGTLALSAIHQLHAQWLLRGFFPERSEQLSILELIANSVDWDPTAFPGDNAYQDFVLEVLRAVGPRGEYRDLYSSNRSLARLGEVLKGTRERFAIEQPKLLTLEAIVLEPV